MGGTPEVVKHLKSTFQFYSQQRDFIAEVFQDQIYA